jgi:endopolyphosphatase
MQELLERVNLANVPLVYTIGNLDVVPKDELKAGPNKILDGLSRVLENILPKDQLEFFRQRGYYVRNVIPGKLTIVSLNTMYFAKYNNVIQGCNAGKKEDQSPGATQLTWLEDTLQSFRSAGVGVYLVGHAPPTLDVWMNSCLDRFSAISVEFKDVIKGQFYGHINFDMFTFLESPKSFKKPKVWCSMESKGLNHNVTENTTESATVSLSTPRQLLRGLYHQFNELRLSNRSASQLAVAQNGASIIPRINPGFRMYYYDKDGESVGNVVDYEQYTLDLSKANQNAAKAKYKLTYKFSELGIQWNNTLDWLDYAKRLFTDTTLHEQFIRRLYPFRKSSRGFLRELRSCLLERSEKTQSVM